jgi:hypothetical protein
VRRSLEQTKYGMERIKRKQNQIAQVKEDLSIENDDLVPKGFEDNGYGNARKKKKKI